MTNEEKQSVIGTVANVATTAIDSLKSQPSLIIIALLNALVFGMLYFGVTSASLRRDEHLMKVIDTCMTRK